MQGRLTLTRKSVTEWSSTTTAGAGFFSRSTALTHRGLACLHLLGRRGSAAKQARSGSSDFWSQTHVGSWRCGVGQRCSETVVDADSLARICASGSRFCRGGFWAAKTLPARSLRFAAAAHGSMAWRGVERAESGNHACCRAGDLWPGPLTGALAILLTDTGPFPGKSFSEALENVETAKQPRRGITLPGAKTAATLSLLGPAARSCRLLLSH